MKRNSFWTLISLFVLGSMILTACGGAATPQTVVQTVEVPVTKQVEVVTTQIVSANPVLYNSYNGDPKPRAFDEAIVQAWNEAHPDMPVQQSIIAHEDFKQAIRAYLTSDPAPDVLTWFAGNLPRFFIDKGLIMDISDVWEKEGWNQDYPKGVKAMSSVDDKQYFLPNSWYWWALYYRKSILEQHGVNPPETWEDLLAACDLDALLRDTGENRSSMAEDVAHGRPTEADAIVGATLREGSAACVPTPVIASLAERLRALTQPR